VEHYCQTNECLETNPSTDLVLMNSVRPYDLQSWIQHKEVNQSNEENEHKRHVYLYSKEFSQVVPMNTQHQFTNTDELPILSLISPFNQSMINQEQEEKYLQIDVQVLRSTVIRSQLLPLEQCDTADSLLDGMKKDLIMNPSNVTPPISVKREKRSNNPKKLARVIS
jgi:hypothetical protein